MNKKGVYGNENYNIMKHWKNLVSECSLMWQHNQVQLLKFTSTVSSTTFWQQLLTLKEFCFSNTLSLSLVSPSLVVSSHHQNISHHNILGIVQRYHLVQYAEWHQSIWVDQYLHLSIQKFYINYFCVIIFLVVANQLRRRKYKIQSESQ